jgi:hypothetical protein
MFSEFEENNLLNQKNNYSVSGYMLFNSSDNSLSKLTSLNNLSMLFSSVLLLHKSKQHFDSTTVFPPLSSLSPFLTHSLKIDSLAQIVSLKNSCSTLHMDLPSSQLFHLFFLIIQQVALRPQNSSKHSTDFLFIYSPPPPPFIIPYTNL